MRDGLVSAGRTPGWSGKSKGCRKHIWLAPSLTCLGPELGSLRAGLHWDCRAQHLHMSRLTRVSHGIVTGFRVGASMRSVWVMTILSALREDTCLTWWLQGRGKKMCEAGKSRQTSNCKMSKFWASPVAKTLLSQRRAHRFHCSSGG